MSSYPRGLGATKLRRAAVLTAGAFLLSGTTTGCSSDAVTDGGSAPCETASMDPALPIDTARDRVTYADHLAIVHWLSEKEFRRIPDGGDPQQGEITRSVTVRVDDVLWSRKRAPELPDEFSYFAWGWTYDGDHRTEASPWGFPRVEEGHTYVMPIARFSDPHGRHPRWSPFADSGVLPYDDGVLGEGETTACAHPAWAPVAQRAVGKGVHALADMLDHTKPDPKALPYMKLDPQTRFQHASR